MKARTIFLFSILLISCNSRDKGREADESEQSIPQKSSALNCYRYATESDTINLKVIHVGEAITGILVYNLKEKDRNKGTIQGSMRGNVLIAEYTFLSEGIQSVRQVAFKLEGNTFIEGYGDSLDQEGKQIFKNLDSLTFNSSIKLSEVACQ